MNNAMGLLMIPLVGAYFVIRKPKHGLPYLAAAVVATLANGVTAKYYDLDGGAPERAWFPAGMAFLCGWVVVCVLIAMFLRSLTTEVQAGTGLSPGQ